MNTLNAIPRTVRFGSGGVILSSRDNTGLDIETIRQRAPSVFAEDKHSSRSERYSYIPTKDVLAGLIREGFMPMEVRQGGSRDDEKRGFTKHMIRLRRSNQLKPVTPTLGVVWPEVVLVNAHDGTSAYQLYAGLFRYVCTNGLIGGQTLDAVKVPHKGKVVDQVIEGAFTVIENSDRMLEAAGEMSSIKLERVEQEAFAEAAIALRYEEPARAPVVANRLLEAHRSADNTSDLWATFNRVQENLLRGGQRFERLDQATGQRTRGTTRPVNGIDGNRDLNRALHTLATRMAELKAA